MKKFGNFICKQKYIVLIVSFVLFLLSIVGMNLTKINYDILVYLPSDIETIKGQKTLTNDFQMGAYSIAIIDNMNSTDILKLEDKIKQVENVNKVVSLYDVVGTSIPIDILPTNITNKLHQGTSTLLFITFNDSTSAQSTIDAVKEIRNVVGEGVKLGGMSSMVLDTMELSEREILIYIGIAVLLCLLVLELSLDSYFVPLILLANIGIAIIYNLGSNIFWGQISYITKALVAVLQLGVTTDFSIFLYHSYEKKKKIYDDKESAMTEAISETFTSVTGSSLTTIAGFLVLCTMKLTLGRDLGIVMAKGVLLGVITVLILFPSMLLVFDNIIEKTKKKIILPNFTKLNKFIVKNNVAIFIIFILLIIPAYLAYSKVDVYYKIDRTLPDTLESITANNLLKDKYNIVSPEIILISKDMKNDKIEEMVEKIEETPGIDFVLSFSKIKSLGITENMLSNDLVNIFQNDKYQMLLVNSIYDIASDELNNQVKIVNDIVKVYDKNAIVAGEGPLMKDLIEISDTDFNNVNYSSIVCIFIILFIILKSLSLPFLLISTIEFAIFINMGVSYFNGTTLPFVAPIVLGTIQLGATIDYAILLTTTYIEKRNNGIAKREAMIETLNYCGSSIFVSGMCFFAATFGVGIYSKLEMVGSLCALISRGAIISMLIVITVLPSILLIFDKLIFKTTIIRRKEMNMKKNIKRSAKVLASYTLIFGIFLSCIPNNVLALTKNETVYSKLNYDGSVNKVIVNEQLVNIDKLDTLEDYSELSDILNITNDNKYTKNDNKLSWNANGKDIFYQGTTNQKLPINIKISYKLDNKETDLDDMLGKSGKVTITVKYQNTDVHYTNVGTLYTPFVVTLGTIIDGENNSNISVTNGKVVSNGTKNIVLGLATPGLYESLNLSELKNSDTISISYDTTNFSLASIYSVATPKLLANSDLEIFNKLDNLYGSVNELQTNMNKINDGANKLRDGSNELKAKLGKSINDLAANNTDALNEEQLNGITAKTVDTVKNMFTDQYKEQIAKSTWETVKSSLTEDDQTVTNIVTESVTGAVTEYLQSVNEYDDYVACKTGETIMNNGGTMTEEQMISCGKIQADTTLPLITKIATTSAINSAKNVSGYVAKKVSDGVSTKVAEETAINTASMLSSSLSNEVANQVKNAANETIFNSLNTLYGGITELDNGINDLSSGISKYNIEGINKLSKVVNGDVRNIQNKINELIKLSKNYQTFTASLNDTTGEAKFLFVTDSKVAVKKTTTLAKKESKTTFWDRVKNLFK